MVARPHAVALALSGWRREKREEEEENKGVSFRDNLVTPNEEYHSINVK